MDIVLIIVSIILITVVLLQSDKSESTSSILTGTSELFAHRKERGFELFISRFTLILGLLFFLISLILFLNN